MNDFIVRVQNIASAAINFEEATARALLSQEKEGFDELTASRRRRLYGLMALSANLQERTAAFFASELDLIDKENRSGRYAPMPEMSDL